MPQLLRKLFRKTRPLGKYIGTFRTCDAAFGFRMPTGFPGTVNRTHPAGIEPCLVDVNAAPQAYGIPVLIDAATQGVRPFAAADNTTPATAYGFTVRPYPMQAASATNYGATAFGAAIPPPLQPIDVLTGGYILVQLNNFAVNNAVKGGAVYVWFAASAGAHVQGGIEAAATGGSTALLNYAYFNGPAGADGVAEVAFNL
jgi:hypothetical protein